MKERQTMSETQTVAGTTEGAADLIRLSTGSDSDRPEWLPLVRDAVIVSEGAPPRRKTGGYACEFHDSHNDVLKTMRNIAALEGHE
jgi:hypothetical protein